jgi:phenylpyruvate tautomerase PptA (4-oxalocrotonate tautomerase family)
MPDVESAAAAVVGHIGKPRSLSPRTATPPEEIATMNCSHPDLNEGAATMPIYTCTMAESTFGADAKRALASEIARIHSSMIHVPSTYVNVAFHELEADGLYAGGVPASPVLVTGWVREGHPADDTTRLATQIATAVTKTLEIDVERVLVVIQPSPARFAVEGGRVLPEPGQENEWLAGS